MTDIKIPIIGDPKKHYGTIVSSPTVFCLHGKAPNTCCEEVSKHCHKPRQDGVDKRSRKKLIIASILCVSFMILEIIGGVLSNSLAIATDAAHLLTDFASFMISLFSIWIAGRKSTKKMSFGWYRAEVIGALISVLMIWVITAILVYVAVQRCISLDFEVNSTIMLITSTIAIIVNFIMGCQLHSTHSHGTQKNNELHGHHENMNVRAAFIHVLGDILQSVGVLIAAVLIYFIPEWRLADPICTFVFSIIVLATTVNILKDALLVLMEGTPSYLDYTEIMELFLQIDGVVRVHNLRIWGLSINKIALSAHLAIRSTSNPEEILKQANTAIHVKYDLFETTLQIEEFRPGMEDCTQCAVPEN